MEGLWYIINVFPNCRAGYLETEQFYQDLGKAMGQLKYHNIKCVMGNFNAHAGEGKKSSVLIKRTK